MQIINHHFKFICYSTLCTHQTCAQQQIFCNQQLIRASLHSAVHYLDRALPFAFRNVIFSFRISKVKRHTHPIYIHVRFPIGRNFKFSNNT